MLFTSISETDEAVMFASYAIMLYASEVFAGMHANAIFLLRLSLNVNLGGVC